MDLEGNGRVVVESSFLENSEKPRKVLFKAVGDRLGFEPNTRAERYHCTFVSVQDKPVRTVKHGIAS
jgi:hypothetical protein